MAQEGEQRGRGQSQAAQAWPKLKQARRVAGFNRSLAMGIAAQVGRGSLKVLGLYGEAELSSYTRLALAQHV